MKEPNKIIAVNDGECIVDVLLKEVSSHDCGSCGKCTFGYEGITQMGMIFGDISQKKGQSGDKNLLFELGQMMISQSICEKGVDIAESVLYAIENFDSEISEHISRKGCRAGVCQKFVSYHVLPDKCVGCGDCIDVCDEDAILGKKKFIHVIEQDECTACGKCMDECEYGAIVKAGMKKPVGPKKPIPCKR